MITIIINKLSVSIRLFKGGGGGVRGRERENEWNLDAQHKLMNAFGLDLALTRSFPPPLKP